MTDRGTFWRVIRTAEKIPEVLYSKLCKRLHGWRPGRCGDRQSVWHNVSRNPSVHGTAEGSMFSVSKLLVRKIRLIFLMSRMRKKPPCSKQNQLGDFDFKKTF